ncbi:MAG TPA: tRNA epoxyqueuosine(34) reductase QueG [Anaeromyxobacteraceae bacterium]|nr:tRNA epoxyqueuosine(34) reductase QueG [Anaeromyxobacteraceae bacterium]
MKAAARAAGFDEVGVARAGRLDPGPLDRMLARGFEADMTWLRTQREVRLDPGLLLPGARSVVALAVAHDARPVDAPPGTAAVARYARGRDYHTVLKRKVKALLAALRERDPALRSFTSVDAGPVMEKAWAERAGIGWVGKNGCLITPAFGSWVLLAAVLLDRELEPDAPHPERCGDCTACMPACPTGAIPEPGLVDARLCISFQTIERRGEVPAGVAERLGRWAFGCDDCQLACPWNRGKGEASDPELRPVRHARVDLRELLGLDAAAYRERFYGTALARAGHAGLVRNGALAAGSLGERSLAPELRRLRGSDLPGVASAAAWALGRLGPDGDGGADGGGDGGTDA